MMGTSRVVTLSYRVVMLAKGAPFGSQSLNPSPDFLKSWMHLACFLCSSIRLELCSG